MGVAELLEIGVLEHHFVRQLVCSAMPAVVHDERAVGLQLLDERGHLRIGIACSRRLTLVGIPHHLAYLVRGIPRRYLVRCLINIGHVPVFVAVVAHEDERVLPGTGIVVDRISDGLVYHRLGLSFGRHGEPSHGHIQLVGSLRIATLSLVEQTEEAIVHVAIEFAERIVALKTQQIVVSIEQTGIGRAHAVVPYAVAKQQQILGHVGLSLRTVVEHLQVAPVGIGIGRTARKLVVQLVGRHDVHPQAIMRLVEVFEPLGLGKEFLTGGDDDDHVGGRVGMVVLVGDAVHILGHRKTGRGQ